MTFKTGFLKIVLASCIWGTMGAFARWSGLGSIDLTFYKTVVACLSLLVINPRDHLLLSDKGKRFVALFIIMGIMYAMTVKFFFSAIYLTTMSNALFAYYIKPVLVAFFAPFFFKEKPELKSFIAVLISLFGLGLILAPSIIDFSVTDIRGVLFALLSAAISTTNLIIIRLMRTSPSIILYYKMVTASLLLIPFIGFDMNFTFIQICIVLIIGVFHTTIPNILYHSGLRTVKASYGITLSYIDPVVASFIGVLLFGEPFTIMSLVGGFLIMLSGALIISTY